MILARTLIEGTAVTFPQNAGAQNCTDLLGVGGPGAGFFGGFVSLFARAKLPEQCAGGTGTAWAGSWGVLRMRFL